MTIELVDVLTPDGKPTGRTKSKVDVHRDGDWHRSAHLWIITGPGHVLLQRRSLQKENHPGLWDVSVAGHISAGESAETAIVREAAEEIGIAIGAEELEHIGTIVESHVLNGGEYLENEFHEIFVMRRTIDLATLELQRGEVDDVAVIPLADLRTRRDLVPHPEEYELLLGRGTT